LQFLILSVQKFEILMGQVIGGRDTFPFLRIPRHIIFEGGLTVAYLFLNYS
jgi:hypothetical protein